jgi:hypothetical protein
MPTSAAQRKPVILCLGSGRRHTGGLTMLVRAVAGTLPVPIKNHHSAGNLARQEPTSDDSGRTQPGSNDERYGHITHANDRRPGTGMAPVPQWRVAPR